jgi:hypothetical protein
MLLDAVPELRDLLPQMAAVSPEWSLRGRLPRSNFEIKSDGMFNDAIHRHGTHTWPPAGTSPLTRIRHAQRPPAPGAGLARPRQP